MTERTVLIVASQMLISLYLIVVLIQPRVDGCGKLHIKIEDIYCEGHSEKEYGYDHENLQYFQKDFHFKGLLIFYY